MVKIVTATMTCEYDFSKHRKLTDQLEKFVEEEGMMGLLSRQGPAGLTNQGATCYLNSLVQTLFHSTVFRSKLYEIDFGDDESSIPLQLQRLFLKLEFADQRSVSTKNLTKSFGWTHKEAFEQQDVQEMCRILFDSLEKHLGGEDLTTPFKGSLLAYTQCQKCQHRRARREEFQDLSLAAEGMSSVEEAIEEFVKVQILDGDNQYFCEKCNTKVDAIKGQRIAQLPTALFLHLKRFVFDWETERRTKLISDVSIPFMIDLVDTIGFETKDPTQSSQQNEPTFDLEDSLSESLQETLKCKFENTKYELTSIIVHAGNAQAGHYYAIVRGDENQWREMNDSQVSSLSEDQVERMCGSEGHLADGGAYMLLYSLAEAPSQKLIAPRCMTWINEFNDNLNRLRTANEMEKKLMHFTAIRSYDKSVPGNTSVQLKVFGDSATAADIKRMSYMALVPKVCHCSLPLSCFRLRLVCTESNELEASLDDLDSTPLKDLKTFSNNCTLYLEYGERGLFTPYNTNEHQQIKVYCWDSIHRISRPLRAGFTVTERDPLPRDSFDQSPFYSLETSLRPIRISSNTSISMLKSSIENTISVPSDCISLFTIPDKKHLEIADVKVLSDDDAIYDGGNTVVISFLLPEALLQEVEESLQYITVYHNNPTAAVKGLSKNFDMRLKVSKNATINEVKVMMLESCGIPVNEYENFHARKSIKSPQLRDESLSIEEMGITDQGVLFIGKGKVIPKDCIQFTFFDHEHPSKAAFKLQNKNGCLVDLIRAQVAAHLGVGGVIKLAERTSSGGAGRVYKDGVIVTCSKQFLFKVISKEEESAALLVNLTTLLITDGVVTKGSTTQIEVDKKLSVEEFQRQFCDTLSFARVAPAAAPKINQMNVFSKLTWMNPSENDADKRNKMAVSKLPLRLTDECVIFCAPYGIEHEENIDIQIEDVNTKHSSPIKALHRRLSTGIHVAAPHNEAIESIVLSPEPIDGIESPFLEKKEGFPLIPLLDLGALPVDRKTYQQEFLEKKEEWSESWREAAEDMLPQEEIAPKYPSGTKVLAKAPAWKRFFPGTVIEFKEGVYEVEFDDGEIAENISEDHLRIPRTQQKVYEMEEEAKSSDEDESHKMDPMEPVMNSDACNPDTENLCPTDKRERRRDKLQSRDFRLQLMFMEDDTHDRRQVASSKAHRPRVLSPAIEKNRAISMPGRTRLSPNDQKPTTLPKLTTAYAAKPSGVRVSNKLPIQTQRKIKYLTGDRRHELDRMSPLKTSPSKASPSKTSPKQKNLKQRSPKQKSAKRNQNMQKLPALPFLH